MHCVPVNMVPVMCVQCAVHIAYFLLNICLFIFIVYQGPRSCIRIRSYTQTV